MQSHCRNCDYPLPEAAKYCPNCAQKNTTGKVNALTFLMDFFAKRFSLNSALFRSIRDLFYPGKLTLEFFKGRHKSYVHPVQLFFVLGVLLFASIAFIVKGKLEKDNNFNINGVNFEKLKEINQIHEFSDKVDTLALNLKETYNHSASDNALDSLRKALPKLKRTKNFRDSISFPTITGDSYHSKKGSINKIAINDLVSYNADELIEKYEIVDFHHQLQFRQILRIIQDGKGFLSFMLGQSIWAIMLSLPLLALFLKLLYIRHDRYYAEHLIFGFHVFAFIFLLLIPVVLLASFLPSWLYSFLILSIFAYLFSAMLNYYQQGIFKTFVKYIAVLISYCFFLGFSIIAVALITVFIF